jgi:CRP/FNR family transcriptional regulator
MDKKTAVAEVELFEGLSDQEVKALADIAVIRDCPRGQDIFHEGEAAQGFFAVASGRVRIFKTALSGKEHILHVFGPGQAFAEVAVFQGGTYPANAQAMEDSRILFFPRAAFKNLIKTHPELGMNMMGLLSGRLRFLVRRVEELSLKEVPARLAAHLLLLFESQGREELTLDLTKGQLASYLGTIQETLSRILKRLSDQGLIAIKGRQVTLLDVEGLKALALGEKLE